MFYGCPTSETNIRAGSRLLFKPVPNSIPKQLHEDLSNAIKRVGGVIDAYLTRCNLPMESEARLVLVVGVGAESHQHSVARRLMAELDPVRWEDHSIDILPFQDGNVPIAVLETGRKIAS